MSTAVANDVFGDIFAVEELVVLLLSYATSSEAVRFCHEWNIPNVRRTLAWPGYAQVETLGDLSLLGSLQRSRPRVIWNC